MGNCLKTSVPRPKPHQKSVREAPEYKAMNQCYDTLVTCIRQSPNDIADKLKPFDMLAPRDWSNLRNQQVSDDEKARIIIDAILYQVKLDPQVFQTFVSALEGAGAWTKTAVKKLNSTLDSVSMQNQHGLHVQQLAALGLISSPVLVSLLPGE